MRMLVACRLPHVALRAARCLPFAANLPVLPIVVCRLPLGTWCLPFCGRCRLLLASRLCRSLLAASPPWHLLLSVRVALSAAFCERLPFPPIAVCRTSVLLVRR